MKVIMFFIVLSVYLISYDKVALVIGNENYANGSLSLPITDAREIGSFLESKGFTVFPYQNLTLSEMKEKIMNMKNQVSEGGKLLFYFSGHGSQIDKENYLIPIDNSAMIDFNNLKNGSINLNYIIKEMQKSKSNINIVMVDACRNNPFATSNSKGIFLSKGSKGLYPVSKDKLDKTFLVFAGAEKDTIPDDGLFRKMFIKYANQSLSLGDIFTKIRNEFINKGRNGIYINDRSREIFKFTGGDIRPKILFQDNSTYHLGDENFGNWERVYGRCYSFSSNGTTQEGSQYKLSLQKYGLESATIYVNNMKFSGLQKQYPKNGRKRPNYWSGMTTINIANSYMNNNNNKISICSEFIKYGDLDDFKIKNITLTKY